MLLTRELTLCTDMGQLTYTHTQNCVCGMSTKEIEALLRIVHLANLHPAQATVNLQQAKTVKTGLFDCLRKRTSGCDREKRE